jgi:ATP-dependent Lhr-like helicase
LTDRILKRLQDDAWPDLPGHTAAWLALQRHVSQMPQPDRLLVESFPHDGREHTCIYGFAGRNAMQTLGLLVTQRMESAGLHPMGFVATDYATLIWGLDRVADAAPLLRADGLQDAFRTWLAGNAVMKRTFRSSATIAGLIDRRTTQGKRSGRQTSFSSDILYDTLVKYDPDHLMLQITREEAMKGLVDYGRIEDMLRRTEGRIDHVTLDRVSPLAAPLLLEISKVPISGSANERLLAEASASLLAAAGLGQGLIPAANPVKNKE